MLIRETLGTQEAVVYEFASGRSTPVPPVTRTWYGNDAVLSFSLDAAGRTVARITAVDGGRVIAVKPLDRDPDRRYMSVVLIPLSGPPPAGALVI